MLALSCYDSSFRVLSFSAGCFLVHIALVMAHTIQFVPLHIQTPFSAFGCMKDRVFGCTFLAVPAHRF